MDSKNKTMKDIFVKAFSSVKKGQVMVHKDYLIEESDLFAISITTMVDGNRMRVVKEFDTQEVADEMFNAYSQKEADDFRAVSFKMLGGETKKE